MVRECAKCYFTGSRADYSSNQWKKGEGNSLCPNCAAGTSGGAHVDWEVYYCSECNREFSEQNYSSAHAARNARNQHQENSHTRWDIHACHYCQKQFSEEDYSNSAAALNARRQHENSAHPPKTYKFFHGTTWKNAQKIKRNGFIPSKHGCLGAGVYVAREPKARKFAGDVSRHDSALGGLVHVLVTVRNVKFVVSNDEEWQTEGFDACRAEKTTASTNMEWCIKDSSQVEVQCIEMIDLRHTPCPVCGDRKFANLRHAVQHVESGYCIGCKGQENARLRIYNFAQKKFGEQLRLTDLSGSASEVPDHPYKCRCDKTFRQLSSLMQHIKATGH